MNKTDLLEISCDESGHTGADLSNQSQPFFSFASTDLKQEESELIITELRTKHKINIPEIKSQKLLKSNRGRKFAIDLLTSADGRFRVNLSHKKYCISGFVVEYMIEPIIYKTKIMETFYKEKANKFLANTIWNSFDSGSLPHTMLQDFQDYIRTLDANKAESWFEFDLENLDRNSAIYLILKTIKNNKDKILKENLEYAENYPGKINQIVDLSISSLWSHLVEWGKIGTPLSITCDESKPLKQFAPTLDGSKNGPIANYLNHLNFKGNYTWAQKGDIQFQSSSDNFSIQVADMIAGSAIFVEKNGSINEKYEANEILNRHLLKDSVFPEPDLLTKKNPLISRNFSLLQSISTINS